MISASAEFKAIWQRKTGTVERRRIGYKRRYYNGSTFVNESSYTYLYESDFVSIGKIPQQIDVPLYNVFTTSMISLKLDNSSNQFIQSNASPSFFAADNVAINGYRLYKTIFDVEIGYTLNAGTVEWLTVFTGYALRSKLYTSNNTAFAEIIVANNSILFEKSDAQAIATAFTLENCIPATGDGSNVNFETTSLGVDHLTDLQDNAASVFTSQGTSWKVSNNNQVAAAGNTGRLAIKFNTAPVNTHTIKSSGIKWPQSQTIDTVVGLLCDSVGITAGLRSISPVIFPGSVSGKKTIDSAADWGNAGASLQNADVTGLSGFLEQRWFLIDNFSDGDYTSGPVWSTFATPFTKQEIIDNGGHTKTYHLKDSDGSTTYTYTLINKTSGTWRWNANVPAFAGTSGKLDVVFLNETIGSHGYAVRYVYRDGVANDLQLIKKTGLSGSTITVLVSYANISSAWHEIRVTRDLTGAFELFVDGVSAGTASDTTISSCQSFTIITAVASGDGSSEIYIDDIYWSPGIYGVASIETTTCVYISQEFDLLAAPTSWGTLDRTNTLNSGTITYETSVSTTSGAGYDAYVAIGADGTILSALKRYLKIRITITPAAASYDSPNVDIVVANFLSSSVFLSIANFVGETVAQALQKLVSLSDYEMGFSGIGNYFFRPKTVSGDAAISLTQENGIIEVIDFDPGFDQVKNVGRVKYGDSNGTYLNTYDGASASEAAPTSETEYGRIPIDLDFTSFMLANDAAIGAARAQSLYQNNYRPKRKIRLNIWCVPWLEVGDKVNFTLFDDPIFGHLAAIEPVVSAGIRSSAGSPDVVFGNSLNMKVVEYIPDWDTNIAETLLEEIL